MGKDERKKELPRFDGRLRDAVTDDMAAYVGEVMSSVAFRGGRKGVHSVRTAQELSSPPSDGPRSATRTDAGPTTGQTSAGRSGSSGG